MKSSIKKIAVAALVFTVMAPATLLAQSEGKDVEKIEQKERKEKKEQKETTAKRDGEQIVITLSGDTNDKMVIELVGDKVIVNGKDIENGKSGDIQVRKQKIRDVSAFGGSRINGGGNYYNGSDNYLTYSIDANHAMLGVTTERADKGVEIQNVTKKSGAEKAGLKEGDAILKIGNTEIGDPDDLSAEIKNHKPGDKVDVTYLRDGKEQKVNVELTKWEGVKSLTGFSNNENLNLNFDKMVPNMDIDASPRIRLQGMPSMNWSWSGGGPKLGLSVQDTEDGKGVNVLEVDEDGNAAKAGIKEEDIITEVDGTAVNGADEMANIMKLMKESKKISVKMKVLRKGKAETIEVKIPRRLKSADL